MGDLTTTKGAGEELKRKYQELDGTSYESKYAGDIAAAVERIKNAGEFNYDSTTDAGYQAAKNQYEKSAQKNMKNTLAASSRLTGGYVNSWGQTAAQQAYDDTMSEAIATLLPQYEQKAYGRYRDGINDNYNQLSVLQGLDATDYGRYSDKLAADQAILNLAATMYDSNRGMDYQKGRDAVADAQWQKTFDRSVYESDRDYEYKVGRDAVADAQWQRDYEAAEDKAIKEAIADGSYFDGWDAGQWESYFARIRNEKNDAAAVEEFNELMKKGYIPTNMISFARSGAYGGMKGH